MVLRRKWRKQKGVVMVVVLIIALAVAIFSYSVLITSLESMERSDVQDYRIKAEALAEGAVQEAAFALKENPEYIDLPENQGILPERAGGYPDSEIKKALISNEDTWVDLWDDFPGQTVRAAKVEHELTSYNYPDLYYIWGDTDEATLEFVDEYEYKRHFYDYHYNPYEQQSDIFISAGAEVDDRINDLVFSFGTKLYPADVTRFQARTNDAWERNENDVLPAYFETEHDSYDLDSERLWTITYDYDPAHPGRDISRIDLIADPGEFSLGSVGDTISIAGWNGVSFDPFVPIPPNYWDGPENAVTFMSDGIPSTTLRIRLKTDSIPDLIPGWNYGFKVGGVRYFFDSEQYPIYYETPHPYDHLGATLPFDPRVQVIYAPFQFDSTDPLASNQVMWITFDWKFFLENGDSLMVINLAANNIAGGILADWTLGDGAGVTLQAQRQNTDVPLAIALLFTSDGDNISSTDNYGYKINKLEYTDRYSDRVLVNDPIMQTPHLGSLGSFDNPFDPAEYMKYNTIHQPNVPGGGTLNGWAVHFDEGCDLFAFDNLDGDYIRITTPGYDPFSGGVIPDVHYFVNPAGLDGWRIGDPMWPNYHAIAVLADFDYDCGLAPFLEIYCHINDVGGYANVAENWGFRANHLFLSVSNASEIVDISPHVAAAVAIRPGEGYTNFGSDIDSRGEWWITEKNAEAIGVHINLETFDLDPGDYLVFFDKDGNEIGRVTRFSYDPEYPEGSGPDPSDPIGSGPDPGDPYGSGPDDGDLSGYGKGTINLNETKGWVIVPGEAAHIVLYGDTDDNEGYEGFEIDRTAWWSGFVNYDSTGPFERIDISEKDYSDYMISGAEEHIKIR